MPKKKLLIFLSYASEDNSEVIKLFNRLKKDGFEPWMDKDRLLPGQDWQLEIERALRKSDAVILCFSQNSVLKESFVQREFKRALEYQEEKPEGEIFVIPIRLDDTNMPGFVSKHQWVDIPAQYSKLKMALEKRQKSLSIKTGKSKMTNKQIVVKEPSPSIYRIAYEKITAKKNQMEIDFPDFNFGDLDGELHPIVSRSGSLAIAQFYKSGMLSCRIKDNRVEDSVATYGDIFIRYMRIGKEPWRILGLPTNDEGWAAPSPILNDKGEGNWGRYSEFEFGEIVWYGAGAYRGQAYVVKERFRDVYDSIKGSGSYLGFPISDTYLRKGIEISEFEGGAIVSLKNGGQISIVRKLLVLNYIDSPFNHNWVKYSGGDLKDCAGVRIDNQISLGKNFVALAYSIDSGIGIYFPIGDISEKYIGATIKSLVPGENIRVYIRGKTNSDRVSILEYNTNDKERGMGFTDEEGVDYWKIPLPRVCNNAEWHTMVVDLTKSFSSAFRKKYEMLERVYFRGSIGIAEILVSDSQEAIEAVSINPIVVE